MVSIGAIFTSTYHTKELNPWPNSPASCVVNYSQLTACQGEMQPFEGNPSNCGHLTGLRNKPQQSSLGNFQHQYLPELLVNVYSYHLMVNSVTLCCVRGRWLFSNLVTYSTCYVREQKINVLSLICYYHPDIINTLMVVESPSSVLFT